MRNTLVRAFLLPVFFLVPTLVFASTITLAGDNPIQVPQYSQYVDPGGTVDDPEAIGESWSDVEVNDTTVDTSSAPGSKFYVSYVYYSPAGAQYSTSATREVHIVQSVTNQAPFFQPTSVSAQSVVGQSLDIRTVVHCYDPDGGSGGSQVLVSRDTYQVAGTITEIAPSTPVGTYEFVVGCSDAQGAAAVPPASVTISVVEQSVVPPGGGTGESNYTYDLGDGLVPCDGVGADGCNACHLVKLGQNILNFLVTISVFIIGIIAAWAGLRMGMSAGNEGEVTAAKNMMTNSVIGLIILLAAWLVINTVMLSLTKESVFQAVLGGPWNQIQCVKQPVPNLVGGPAAEYPHTFQGYTYNDADKCRQEVVKGFDDAAACETALSSFKSSGGYVTILCDGSASGDPEPSWFLTPLCGGSSTVPPDHHFDFQPGIAAQQSHASADLNTMLNCMSNKVPGDVGVISSISDSKIVDGTYTFAYCDQYGKPGGCAHSANSCHYGRSQVGQSYAVDFGDEQHATELMTAARECGGTPANEGNHIHVSSPGCR